MKRFQRVPLLCLLLAGPLLNGCGSGTAGINASGGGGGVFTPASLRVLVSNGATPLAGIVVQMYVAGSSGVRSAASPLGLSATTDASGVALFAPPSSCSVGAEVYAVAVGGTNSAVSLLSALGPCTALSTSAMYHVDEATTVAAAFALSAFVSDAAHLGAAAGNSAGLANAFAMASLLVDSTAGTSPGLAVASGVTVPSATLNTLANLLAGCVHAASATAAACATLLTATSTTTTLDAVIAIAHQPGSFTALASLASAFAPFAPALASAPADWTLVVQAKAAGLNAPYGIALDAAGDAWISNEGAASVVELTPTGAPGTTISGGGLLGPRGIAIDRTGNLWVASTGNNSLLEFSSSGAVIAKISNGLSAPVAVAADATGAVWVSNFGSDSVAHFSANAALLNTVTGLSRPAGVAIDGQGNVWVANSGASNLAEISASGALVTTVTDQQTLGAALVSLDGASNVWIAGAVPSVSGVSAGLASFTATGAAQTSLINAQWFAGGIAAAGSDVWITDTAGGLVQYRNGTLMSAPTGFGALQQPVGVAVDGAGNVWTANAGDNSVSIFVGLTSPQLTPLAANVGP